MIDESATWALERAADSAAQQRTGIWRARERRRLLEAVPEFAVLAMPERDLD